MLEVLAKRRSVRSFSGKPVSEEELNEVLKAGIFAPSGADRRPVHYIIVRNQARKDDVAQASKWSGLAKNAPVLIAVCADMERGKRWVEDCSLAAGYMMLQAASMGMGTCWIQMKEASRDDDKDAEDIVKSILSLPKGFRVLCVLALGHPKSPPKQKTEADFKGEFKERIHVERF